MNQGSTTSSRRKPSAARQTDPAKLMSLLALATGTAAIPQTSNADIIYQNLNSGPVTVGSAGLDHYTFILPGTVQFGLARNSSALKSNSGSRTFYYRSVIAGKIGAGASAKVHASNRQIIPHAQGDVWQGQNGLATAAVGTARQVKSFGTPVSSSHSPDSYSGHKYLAFQFADSTQANKTLYGWAEISLINGNLASSTGPNVTIYGYAYDDSGAFIAAGETTVPEPSSMAFLAVGALTLGAKGLRAWRRKPASTPAA